MRELTALSCSAVKRIWRARRNGSSPAAAMSPSGARNPVPGHVLFADATATKTPAAAFSVPGDYVLKLTATGDDKQAYTPLRSTCVRRTAPPKDQLDVVYTTKYAIDSPLWNARAKTLIVDWIPHCIAQIERTDLTRRERAASTISSKRPRRCAANPMPATRATSFPMPGSTRPWSRCASRRWSTHRETPTFSLPRPG